jgi:hypothetical protein
MYLPGQPIHGAFSPLRFQVARYALLVTFQDVAELRGLSQKLLWLVLWNMDFIFAYIGNNHPN